jgi:mannonate dehydratase
MRLFAGAEHEENLFADISTLAHTHHGLGPLRELLKAPELHHRLVYGSDYPLPALRFMLSPSKLQLGGLLDSEDRRMCNELFRTNPLLFDFAVNRSLRLVENGKVDRFSTRLFETEWLFT